MSNKTSDICFPPVSQMIFSCCKLCLPLTAILMASAIFNFQHGRNEIAGLILLVIPLLFATFICGYGRAIVDTFKEPTR